MDQRFRKFELRNGKQREHDAVLGSRFQACRDLTLEIIFHVMFGVAEGGRAEILKRCVHRMMDGVGAKLAFVPFLRVIVRAVQRAAGSSV